jgi:hypothetical protein
MRVRYRLRNVSAVACCAHASSSADGERVSTCLHFPVPKLKRLQFIINLSAVCYDSIVYLALVVANLRSARCLHRQGLLVLAVYWIVFSAKFIYALDIPRSRTLWNLYQTCSSVVLPVYSARIGIPRSRNMYVNLLIFVAHHSINAKCSAVIGSVKLVLVLQLRVVTCLLSSVSLVSVP